MTPPGYPFRTDATVHPDRVMVLLGHAGVAEEAVVGPHWLLGLQNRKQQVQQLMRLNPSRAKYSMKHLYIICFGLFQASVNQEQNTKGFQDTDPFVTLLWFIWQKHIIKMSIFPLIKQVTKTLHYPSTSVPAPLSQFRKQTQRKHIHLRHIKAKNPTWIYKLLIFFYF